MKQAFVFDTIAVIVSPWHEPMDPPERGTRVEVRLLADEPRRGTGSAAQRVVIDQPLFRADLFDQVTAPPGNLRSAHYHPHFDGIEPCDRVWLDEIKTDPTGWLAKQLNDLPALMTNAGLDVSADASLTRDTDALRGAIPSIIAAVEATWSAVRAEP